MYTSALSYSILTTILHNYKYSGTSLIRSPTELGKSYLNEEVTVLQGANLHCRIQFGTEQG